MGKLLPFYLSLIGLAFSCSEAPTLGTVTLSIEERDSLIAMKYEEFFQTHQGTPRAMTLLDEILELDSSNAEAWREKSIPYLKRGLPHQWYENYKHAIEFGAEEWIGWRGYNYLFFYKDFRRAINDFNATDSLNPEAIDHPQAMSVDLLRGIAYFGLQSLDTSLFFFDKYIHDEMENGAGLGFIDQTAFLYRGLIFQKQQNHLLAIESFKTGLKIFEESADLHFHLSRSFLALKNLTIAQEECHKAAVNFRQGYFHHRPYVEVLEQIYDYDIDALELELKIN